MVKKVKEIGLPYTTRIEVVARCGNKVRKKITTYGEALEAKKNPKWTYRNYQIGYCSENNTEE